MAVVIALYRLPVLGNLSNSEFLSVITVTEFNFIELLKWVIGCYLTFIKSVVKFLANNGSSS